ncbi:MAG: preprotein translocase subunit SecY [Candidatus Taylorbacteria bacterium RIFOXYD2_FULL_36_9]|uniref:Protein translocase subunit SecY n=1 Tax=Candidatus Taylorbacteria bacterium RIFOXYD2_FULL_36_9 TaxID=1802338 RepID=A0A1G2PCC6_9BACT|nr:MAG: preprotein translocase subunit SecY [Candidatus Taylorbacteria bacterium RIFOXYD2_FULL_36_9]
MQNFLKKISLIFHDSSLRKRILFVVVALIIFRFLSTIPVPGIDPLKLQAFFNSSVGDVFGLFSIFSGGGLSNLSIVMLGVGPYITASIVMQLLTMIFPKLKEMYQEEGEAGRAKFTQYSRLLTVPLALIQGGGFLLLLQKSNVVTQLGSMGMITNIVVVVAGSILLMWIGELMTEFGIGNGTSLIIFAGIVANIPTLVSQSLITFSAGQIPLHLAFIVVALLVILGVVIVTEAERPIPVTYAKRVRGNKVYGGVSTYLPLRVNQAGVIPIIFALSLLIFPQMIFQYLATGFSSEVIKTVATFILNILKNGWFYSIFYFILVFLFTYFYTAVTFDPHAISENLQKNGAFIPGVRPGQSTSEYIAKVLTRITMVGATFLGAIAVLPLAMKAVTGIQSLAIGGTALLIVVSVVIDLMKKIDAQVSMREY